MKVCLISFSKSANLGDLLIASELAGIVGPDVELTTLSYSDTPQVHSDKDAYDTGFVPIRTSALRTSVRRWIHRIGATRILRSLRGRRSEISSPWHQVEVEEALAAADLVVIGGGNMIFDTVPWTEAWRAFEAAIEVPLVRGTPILAVALGIGPFATSEQEESAVAVLSRCDYVSFRDQASLDLYQKYVADGGQLSVDPVFGWETTVLGPSSERPAIGINCVDLRLADAGRVAVFRANRAYENLIRQILGNLANDVILFSTDLNDYPLLIELQRRVASDRCRVQNIAGVQDLILLYGHLGVVVGSRMHVLITAFTQLIPAVSITWQAKVSEYRKIVGERESEILMEDLMRSTDDVVERVREKLQRTSGERKEIEARLDQIRRRLALGNDEVRRVAGALHEGA